MSSPEIISVIIQPDGITAKEVNPIKMPDAFFEGRKKEWNEAQNKLRTFEIEGAKEMIEMLEKVEQKMGGKITHIHMKTKIGETYKAEILPNGKIKIV